jgi:2-keto-4-pentenoate hydratase/2-oxohepta-3-ene-1,7-dioic acid hydratase in catechol pathway
MPVRLGLVAIDGQPRLVIAKGDRLVPAPGLPADPLAVLTSPELRAKAEQAARDGAATLSMEDAAFLLPLARVSKIICVGLNYADHAAESPYDKPDYPIYFLRVASSLIPHGAPIIRPVVSERLDFEGEMVAVIGKAGRAIPMDRALDHVVAYSLFNDGSIRDYQFKGPQWTLGKNFDGTGAFGPLLVSTDEVSEGAKGLTLETRLNGAVVQKANTDDLLFPIAELITRVSEAMTLEPGDIIVTGTPAGVGFARKPPLFMKEGDVCEVEVTGLGVLRNPVKNEAGRG